VGCGSTYPSELRKEAFRMVAEVRLEYPSDWTLICAVASQLGIGSAMTTTATTGNSSSSTLRRYSARRAWSDQARMVRGGLPLSG
jgi:hypothetical protein